MKWIFLASILPVLSLLTPGMPIVHDGQDHVARIANFYLSLSEGNIIPRWAGNLNWGYGHPILMFLYPLPEYMASAFHFVGFSLVDSTKLVFGLSYIASAITMFLWMRSAFGFSAGVIGALLYSFAPYRFVDLYVRGALGEHVAFIFIPLVLFFLHKRQFIFAAMSIAALILSHNAIALMALPIIGFYGLYLLLFEEKKKLLFTIHYLLFVLLGFGLSSFFWLPALFEGKFTLRYIVTAGEALTRFVPIPSLFYSPWNYGGTQSLSKTLGWSQWMGVLGAILFMVKTGDKKLKIVLRVMVLMLLFSLFMMTSWSAPIWQSSHILQNFQFPWRFLSVSVFAAAVMGGIAFSKISRVFLIPHILFIIVITVGMWHPKGYQLHEDAFYSGVYSGTTDTGESSPIWSVRFMEQAPSGPIEVIDGEATVRVEKRTSTVHEYTIDAVKPTLMKENTLYFPGWVIYLNGQQTDIEWQNPTYRGLMTFSVPPGDSQSVRVVFENTKIRKAANWASMLSLLLLVPWGMIKKHYR